MSQTKKWVEMIQQLFREVCLTKTWIYGMSFFFHPFEQNLLQHQTKQVLFDDVCSNWCRNMFEELHLALLVLLNFFFFFFFSELIQTGSERLLHHSFLDHRLGARRSAGHGL